MKERGRGGERARERESEREGKGSSIWRHAAINKLYEKAGDIYLIKGYLRNRNKPQHFVPLLLANKCNHFTSKDKTPRHRQPGPKSTPGEFREVAIHGYALPMHKHIARVFR